MNETPPVKDTPPGQEPSPPGYGEVVATAPPLPRTDVLQMVEFTADGTTRTCPPTYEEAINPASAPPPTYESLFGRVREVHRESSGSLDFIKNVVFLLIGTIGFTIFIGVILIIPISMFIIGLIYLQECPVDNHIPLYLFVGGIFGIFKQYLDLSRRLKNRRRVLMGEEIVEKSNLQSFIGCFMMFWFIMGSYWVYKEYEPSYDPMSGVLYCNKTVYLFAFWQITSVYLVFALLTVCLCCVNVAVIAFDRYHTREESLPRPN